ncbi:diaminopimelate epimerase [Pseudomonas lundensis]|uniref:diaminopimelate epimerase n=1 Tax=Serratia proteamaculans TaxID=28151 RepID=UPI002981F96E|nr:diaminopimelate epimerase [Serratia proteamaculans]MDW5500838.1 diaminopimelate epimerase [Serratia proteamaculans]MDW5505903.1 diaminopimelate epimerase [Pseudomonas lundensis]
MTPLLFHKYHGLGNDYLVCHRSVATQLTNEQIRILCHRHYGIGSDGLLIDSGDSINPTLRIINPDGSEAEKSGNGLRIYARYLFDIGRVNHLPFWVHTAGGDVRCQVNEDKHQVQVDMGRANFNPASLPALVDLPEALNYPLSLAEETLSVSLVSMGNPHCVVPVTRLDLAQVHRLGPQIEHHPLFPKRTNVQLVEVIDRNTLHIGIWERGAGFTMASGSSSCAAASVMRKMNQVNDKVTVHMPGGQLQISFSSDFQVTMLGPVHKIASLTLDKDCFIGGVNALR